MSHTTGLRLVGHDQGPTFTTDEERIEAARGAYTVAREAQRTLVAHLPLTTMLHRPGVADRTRLRGELYEARQQALRAQAVVDALTAALDAIDPGGRR